MLKAASNCPGYGPSDPSPDTPFSLPSSMGFAASTYLFSHKPNTSSTSTHFQGDTCISNSSNRLSLVSFLWLTRSIHFLLYTPHVPSILAARMCACPDTATFPIALHTEEAAGLSCPWGKAYFFLASQKSLCPGPCLTVSVVSLAVFLTPCVRSSLHLTQWPF